MVTDYMARSRRYMPDEAEEEQNEYYHRDHLGSVTLLTQHDVLIDPPQQYTYDAWGEHVDTAALPSVTNNVRYAGAYLETFVDAGNSLDAIYLCGERHYWPAYGRFLQRDPLCYRKMPNPTVPLNVNPYIYAQNNPVMQKDLTGLASTWVRGCHRGGRTLRLGGNYPSDPSQVDCANIPEISPDDAMDGLHILQAPMGKPGLGGMLSARDALNVMGREADLCNLDHRTDPQPKNACAQITYVSAELCCHYLDKCGGDDKSDDECQRGRKSIDIGFASHPLDRPLEARHSSRSDQESDEDPSLWDTIVSGGSKVGGFIIRQGSKIVGGITKIAGGIGGAIAGLIKTGTKIEQVKVIVHDTNIERSEIEAAALACAEESCRNDYFPGTCKTCCHAREELETVLEKEKCKKRCLEIADEGY